MTNIIQSHRDTLIHKIKEATTNNNDFVLVYMYNNDGRDTKLWNFTPQEMKIAFDNRPIEGYGVNSFHYLKPTLEEIAKLAGRVDLDIPKSLWENSYSEYKLRYIRCAYGHIGSHHNYDQDHESCSITLKKDLAMYTALSYKEMKEQNAFVRHLLGGQDKKVLFLLDKGQPYRKINTIY